MNIAFILPSLKFAGPILVVKDLVSALVAHGHTITVFYFDDVHDKITFSCKTSKISFRSKVDFRTFDVVHSHGLRPDLYNYLYNRSKPRISTIHSYIYPDLIDFYPKPIAFLTERFWLYILSNFDKVVTLTNNAKEYYTRGIKRHKLEVIYNTKTIDSSHVLDEDTIRDLMKIKERYKVLGMNVSLIHKKGIDIVIKTLKLLPDFCLYVIGEGNYRESLLQIAEKEGVIDRCFFKGFQTDGYRFIPYYDVYVMASRSEGFPLCLIEAAQCKSLVACSKLPVFKEIYGGKNAVAFFDSEDVSSLKNAIMDLITYPDSYKENLYNFYTKNLSPDVFVSNYLEVYRSCLLTHK